MAKRKGGLGRGLDALFADAAPLFEEDLEQNEEENIDTKLLDIIDDVTGDKSRERFDSKSKAKSNKNHKTKSDIDEAKGNSLNSTKEDKTPREHAVQLEERNIKDSKGETSQTQADSAKIEADEDRVLYIDINALKPKKTRKIGGTP